MTRVGDWIAALESLYDPSWAADWDAVGLVAGDPDARADEALFAIDPVEATVDEAVRRGARLLVTHHPLLLRGVHGVPVTDYKGRLVDRLVREGIALYVAHTNADVAAPGVRTRSPPRSASATHCRSRPARPTTPPRSCSTSPRTTPRR